VLKRRLSVEDGGKGQHSSCQEGGRGDADIGEVRRGRGWRGACPQDMEGLIFPGLRHDGIFGDVISLVVSFLVCRGRMMGLCAVVCACVPFCTQQLGPSTLDPRPSSIVHRPSIVHDHTASNSLFLCLTIAAWWDRHAGRTRWRLARCGPGRHYGEYRRNT
jgi:hypothetical protein